MGRGYDTQFLSSAHDVMKLIFAVLYVSLNDGPYTLL